MKTEVIFVGQGSNQACWLDSLERGRRHHPKDEARQLAFAEEMCRRLALTGAVGKKIAALLGISLQEFRQCHRRNLNARWNGKNGKGDAFDKLEAERVAATLLATAAHNSKIVLLGANVCEAFGQDLAPLESTRYGGLNYFHLPHPSGINRWWNSTDNLLKAEQRLKRFVFDL